MMTFVAMWGLSSSVCMTDCTNAIGEMDTRPVCAVSCTQLSDVRFATYSQDVNLYEFGEMLEFGRDLDVRVHDCRHHAVCRGIVSDGKRRVMRKGDNLKSGTPGGMMYRGEMAAEERER
jgi:hypothetical protein